ncbi:MAG: AMP-binding protein [Planctomycetota bacterium]
MQNGLQSFIEHFDQVVKVAPSRIAVECNGQSVTYLELQRASLRIAKYIEDALGEPDDIIGLNISKSPRFLSAAIGCWRQRCAWVPIASNLPQARQRFVLADCNPRLVFTDDPNEKRFTRLPDDLGRRNAENVVSQSYHPDDLAYVIYTSGTTGNPNGVEVTHRGIMNLLSSQVSAFGLDADSRAVWYYPTSFDASVSDWGTALYAGATLLFEKELDCYSASELTQWLNQRRVSHADLPPSLLKLLPEPDSDSSLRTVVVGGQSTDPETIRRWGSRIKLVNVYGPTEATVCTSLNICVPEETRSLLGQPIHGVEYRVVDSSLKNVPYGDAGELLISGPCLARGYRNQIDKTRRMFIEVDGQRSYRSGFFHLIS